MLVEVEIDPAKLPGFGLDDYVIVADIAVAGAAIVKKLNRFQAVDQLAEYAGQILVEILFMLLIDIVHRLKNRRSADEINHPDIVVLVVMEGITLHEPPIALDYLEDLGFLVRTAITADLENPDMNVKFLVENRFEYFMLPGFQVDSPENPILGLVSDSESGFIAIAFDNEIVASQPENIAALDTHAIGSVGDNTGSVNLWPASQLLDSSCEFVRIIIHTLNIIGQMVGRSLYGF